MDLSTKHRPGEMGTRRQCISGSPTFVLFLPHSTGGLVVPHSKDDPNSRLLHFVIIKPSHYDDHGYPIQWFRSAIPSNTLACLN